MKAFAGTLIPRASVFFGALCCAIPVLATPINLDTGKTLGITSSTSSLVSGTLTFSMTNTSATPDAVTTLNAWNLGFQVLPIGIVTGSVTPISVFNPATNPVLAGPSGVDPATQFALVLTATTNGTKNAFSWGMAQTDGLDANTLGVNTTKNFASFVLQASVGASGTWGFFAVNQSLAGGPSYWADTDGASTAFGNLPATNGSSLQIGTITVTAVPEPSSIVLAAFAVAGAGWFAVRARGSSRIAIVEAPSDA